ncbi:MAG: hypothetical protein ACREK6_21995 [Candidatus Rokuibacteriota bacterium]
MLAHENDCRRLALKFLADYRLTPGERVEEAERLAQSIRVMIEAELDSLGVERVR